MRECAIADCKRPRNSEAHLLCRRHIETASTAAEAAAAGVYQPRTRLSLRELSEMRIRELLERPQLNAALRIGAVNAAVKLCPPAAEVDDDQ